MKCNLSLYLLANFKGALNQIWKSAYIFVFMLKKYAQDFKLQHFLSF